MLVCHGSPREGMRSPRRGYFVTSFAEGLSLVRLQRVSFLVCRGTRSSRGDEGRSLVRARVIGTHASAEGSSLVHLQRVCLSCIRRGLCTPRVMRSCVTRGFRLSLGPPPRMPSRACAVGGLCPRVRYHAEGECAQACVCRHEGEGGGGKGGGPRPRSLDTLLVCVR